MLPKLRFGIPSIDELLELQANGSDDAGGAESYALVGPDGSGKSVLALHMASRYYADCYRATRGARKGARRTPRIVYVSSDLRTSSAKSVWKHFDLGQPNRRQIPFERMVDALERFAWNAKDQNYEVNLEPLDIHERTGSGSQSLIGYLLEEDGKARQHQIGFLDLASNTAGDDWNFVNMLLAKLESIETARIAVSGSAEPVPLPHLVLIDSVLGFETFVGKLDAYGVEQTRRARIAQCMRNAGKHCHLLFVVEEPVENEHLPEEYVTDVVLRLRNRSQSGTSIRTLEIEKARARSHAVGEQVFDIRGPEGSSTGVWENADTPVTRNAYVHVFHSIPHRNAVTSTRTGEGPPGTRSDLVPFGLEHLDDLLEIERGEKDDKRAGLRAGTCSALIGDASTGKSSLGERFLATGFCEVVCLFMRVYAGLDKTRKQKDTPEQKRKLKHAAQRLLGTLRAGALSGKLTDTDRNEAIITPKSVADALAAGMKASWQELKEALHDKEHKRHREIWTDESLRNEVAKLVMGDVPHGSKTVDPYRHEKNTRAPHVLAWGKVPAGEIEPKDLVSIFDHPNLRYPAVLLTTSDRRPVEMAKACLIYLEDMIRAEMVMWWGKDWQTAWKRLEQPLIDLLECQLIIRRFDIANTPASVLFHVMRRNGMEAKKLIYGPFFPPGKANREKKTERIRLVIDDLRVLCNICPDAWRDTSFLPFLTFSLERSGITSLLVYTDAVRPDKRPEDETSRALMSLLKRSILLWNVPFEGRSRVAIGVIPPSSEDTTGIVRQLSLVTAESHLWPEDSDVAKGIPKRPVPQVTPKFELYSGIEEGKPKPVPLAIYMFAETKQFESYIEEENTLFRELFTSVEEATPVNPGRVIYPLESARYLAMRDYTHLSMEAQDAHTMVFQVDGSWAQRQGTLEDQREYLERKLPEGQRTREAEDPFGLFPPKVLSGDANIGKRRLDYFRNVAYRPTMPGTDRTPFMWDFGFVLARSAPWEVAFEGRLQPSQFSKDDSECGKQEVGHIIPFFDESSDTVRTVYDKLQGRFDKKSYISWRKFLGACRTVADTHHEQTGAPAIAFDIAAPSAETINTLLLEIWISELMLEYQRLKHSNLPIYDLLSWEELVGGKRQMRRCLRQLLMQGVDTSVAVDKNGRGPIAQAFHGFQNDWIGDHKQYEARTKCFQKMPIGALCLYKAWLLLLEVLNFDDYLDSSNIFTFRKARQASIQAMASRHWYKTACAFSNEIYETEGIHDAPAALRLPGSFSVRGDWFLGSPRSSRSRLLARHAFDLLSSRRANLSRLQRGLGLPVRDVLPDGAAEEIRTALRCKIKRHGATTSTQLTYKELTDLGGTAERVFCESFDSFRWLWRPAILDYDRLSRAFQKWTARLFRWTIEYRKRKARMWHGGFPGYDDLTCRRFDRISEYESFAEFGSQCDVLIAELEAALRGQPDGDSESGEIQLCAYADEGCQTCDSYIQIQKQGVK
jgi:KaiC/GvpD/RAD55 family RecA-like ATPase